MKIEGQLEFKGWVRPWYVFTNGSKIDIWPLVENFFTSLHGKTAKQETGKERYCLMERRRGKYVFLYEPLEYAWLKKKKRCEFVAVNSYLATALMQLSGREIKVEIDENQLEIAPV